MIEYLADCGYEPLGDVLREARDPADLGTLSTSGLKKIRAPRQQRSSPY